LTQAILQIPSSRSPQLSDLVAKALKRLGSTVVVRTVDDAREPELVLLGTTRCVVGARGIEAFCAANPKGRATVGVKQVARSAHRDLN